MIEAILFDMDGVLADSEPLWNEIDGALMKSYGVTYGGELKPHVLGKSFPLALEFYRKTFDIEATIEEMSGRRLEIGREFYASRIEMFAGVPQVLADVRAQGFKTSLATSTIRDLAFPFLERHKLLPFFDAITTGDEVQNGKPNPDIYLLAARKIAVAPEKCLVVEDALAGIQAGKASGAQVVAIPDEQWGDVTMLKEAADDWLHELAQLPGWLQRRNGVF